jgi:hypothetical protein
MNLLYVWEENREMNMIIKRNFRAVTTRILKLKNEKFILMISSMLFSITVMTSNLSAQRNNPPAKKGSLESDFKYEEIGDFSESSYFIADIIPLRSMLNFNYQNLGSGVGLGLYNIKGKFSIEADYIYNYFNYAYRNSEFSSSTLPYKKSSSMEYGGILGFTFKSKKEKQDSYTLLKVEGNVRKYSNLPAVITTAYSFQIGFKSIGLYNLSNPTFTGKVINSMTDSISYKLISPTVRSLLNNRSLYLGVKRTISRNTKFKTDKYGEVRSTRLNEIYGGMLIGLKSKFPTIYQLFKEDNYEPQLITSVSTLPLNGQEELENNYKFLPVGMRLGWMNSDRSSGMAFSWEIALYPGYHMSVLQQVNVRLGLNFRIVKNHK